MSFSLEVLLKKLETHSLIKKGKMIWTKTTIRSYLLEGKSYQKKLSSRLTFVPMTTSLNSHLLLLTLLNNLKKKTNIFNLEIFLWRTITNRCHIQIIKLQIMKRKEFRIMNSLRNNSRKQ